MAALAGSAANVAVERRCTGCGLPLAEVGRTLLILMRRGSLSAAEEVSGHKYETVGRGLRIAAQHSQAITEVLVQELHPTEVEVDL